MGVPVIEFNKPAKFWDGTETLSYPTGSTSRIIRLPISGRYRSRRVDLVMIGAHDEAIDPEALRAARYRGAPNAQMTVVPETQSFRHIQHARAYGR